MAERFYVRAENHETGEKTVSESSRSEADAVRYAVRIADGAFEGDDATWHERTDDPHFALRVGRMLDDGTRSEPIVTITVEAREAETE